LTKQIPVEVDKLWYLVDHLGYDLEPSILIGGWATQLRVGGEISKDVDLIINSDSLRGKLRTVLTDYSENHIHGGGKKVQGTVDGIHVDAYIPHESFLGQKLKLDVATLAKHTESDVVRGWLLLTIEAHLVTKFAAVLDRPDSEKGSKDAREIVALIQKGVEPEQCIEIMFEASSSEPEQVLAHLVKIFELVPDLAKANKALRKQLADLKREWVDYAELSIRRQSSN
jgi:hypothetical protein